MTEQTDQTRRNFLAQSMRAAAGAGLLAAGVRTMAESGPTLNIIKGPQPRIIDPNQTIRLGLVGVGGRGRDLLKVTLQQKNISVIAIADPNRKNVDQALKMIKEKLNETPEVYAGPEDYKNKLLARDDIDAVFLATPCYLHVPMYLDCFAAGMHFYGEKPMAICVRGADAMVGAQKKNPRVIAQIGFQRRASTRYQVGVKKIQEGVAGDPFDGRGAWLNAWGPLGLPGTDTEWFGRREKSGDWMLEQACHTWDVFNWICGSPPSAASGIGRKDIFEDMDPARDVTDFYFAHLEYPNGLIVDFEHSWVCPHKDEGKFSGVFERVAGKKGGVSLGLHPPDCKLYFRDKDKEPVDLSSSTRNGNEETVESFFTALRNNSKPVSGVENGREATLAGLLVRKAVDERRWVTMKEIIG